MLLVCLVRSNYNAWIGLWQTGSHLCFLELISLWSCGACSRWCSLCWILLADVEFRLLSLEVVCPALELLEIPSWWVRGAKGFCWLLVWLFSVEKFCRVRRWKDLSSVKTKFCIIRSSCMRAILLSNNFSIKMLRCARSILRKIIFWGFYCLSYNVRCHICR